jgi:methyltransferase (TIGR00027 family)
VGQYQQWDIVSGVGITALAVAAARAVESSRPDRLMEDPYAAGFVAAVHSPVPVLTRWPGPDDTLSAREAMIVQSSSYQGLRSRVFDDYLRGACERGVGQVVIVAAGLDARAFRLDWPAGLRLFEIDQPKVLDFKDTVLTDAGALARCARTVVAVDLREDWSTALIAAGFDRDVPTAWLAEGLLPYLPAEAEQRLFENISALSAAGSHIAVERNVDVAAMVNGAGLRRMAADAGIALGRLFNTEPRPDPATRLTGDGWSVAEESAADAAGRYDRDAAALAMGIGDHAFLTATRGEPTATRGEPTATRGDR